MDIEYPTVQIPDPGIEGLDELAARLRVQPANRSDLALIGKSGQCYDLVALLAAVVAHLDRALPAGR